MSGFEKLTIYKKALQGVKLIYEITRQQPLKGDFSLVDQVRRASYSIVANIAEGYGRTTKRDRAQFLTYAVGSTNEVISYLDIIKEICPIIEVNKIKEYYDYLGKQIYLFRKNLIS